MTFRYIKSVSNDPLIELKQAKSVGFENKFDLPEYELGFFKQPEVVMFEGL